MVDSQATSSLSARSLGLLHYLNPKTLIRDLWQHRNLIVQFTRREIEGRYKASFLGIFWSFINPLILLFIYTFVFGIVFKARWPDSKGNSLSEFALILFCGLTAFTVFSECLSRSSTLIIGVPNYVKKVVFPLEILPVSVLGSALFHGLISLGILLGANLVMGGRIYWTIILLPVVALPLIFLSLGLMWFLSSLGVFVRDINHIVTLVVQVLFYASAIMYPLDKLPTVFQTVIRFNPLTPIVEDYRRVILWGRTPSWSGLTLWILATGAVMLLGYVWFMKTKKAFADVI